MALGKPIEMDESRSKPILGRFYRSLRDVIQYNRPDTETQVLHAIPWVIRTPRHESRSPSPREVLRNRANKGISEGHIHWLRWGKRECVLAVDNTVPRPVTCT